MSKPLFAIIHSLDINKEFTNEIFMSIIIACKTEYASTSEEDAALNACKVKYDKMIDELANTAFKTGKKMGKKIKAEIMEETPSEIPASYIPPVTVLPMG